MAMPIGQHLRNIRKKSSMTLQQLSSHTGFSIGYLSNIERDLVSPTITVLSSICAVLDTDLTSFLQPLSPKVPVLKKSARETVYSSQSAKVKYESITPNGFKLKGLCITIQPGCTSSGSEFDVDSFKPHSHTSDELGIILQGTLSLVIGDKTYNLEQGDSFCIESGVSHWYMNTGETVSVHYSINV